MRRQFKIVFWLVLLGISIQFAVRADTEAQKLLAQSEESLEKAESFKVDYRAFQEHIAAVPELGMAGSLTFQSGNRFYLTNTGVFFIFDGQMECVSDGTNYLAVIAPRTIQWERKSIHPNFNKSLVRFFVYGGATPIVASQLATGLTQEGNNPAAKPLPFLTNQFSVSDERFVGDETMEGKASKHIELTFNSPNEPAKIDLWLDKTTLFPTKRISHDRSSGDVIETYAFELNPSISSDTFSTHRIIQNRKLGSVIQQMEMPDALLLKASRNGDVKLVADSLAIGANPNAKTSFMDRPPSFPALAFAVKAGNLELVKLLVEHGAEVNAGALSGATPLQFACMDGKTETVNYLIEHGASLTNATASLCWAAWRGYSNIVVLLVEKGVPIDQPAGELGTPLQKAVDGGFVDIASFLIKHGADINKSEGGSTPLHNAVRFGSPETVKFLLEVGAKPNARDSYGVTPLMYAASGNHAEAAKLLLENGADSQLKNSKGQTAMDLVSHHLPNKEITDLFVKLGLIKPVQPNSQKH
jgi:ankyrin repeat protein